MVHGGEFLCVRKASYAYPGLQGVRGEESQKVDFYLALVGAYVLMNVRRFHPDRWRARGLLKNMQDDDERGFIEVAANTVAQALTPLWREVKGN